VTKPADDKQSEPLPAELERDFDFMMRHAGIEVMEDRRTGAVHVYRDLMRAVALVHTTRSPRQWVAHAYSVDTVTRAKDEPR
jgi:hypothetical protein